jgi:hypothetical protein
MSTQIQRRRGTTAEHSTFTGVEGELTVDTTKDTAVVHDGTTVGGHPLQKQYPPLGSAAAPTYTFTGDTNTGIYSPGADQVAVATNGTGRLFVNSAGLVSIGSGTPDVVSLLTINAPANTRYGIGINSTAATGGNFYATRYLQEGTHLGSIFYTTSTSELIRHAALNGIAFHTGSAAAGAERLRITSAGLVGIGTSSPDAPFHVRGAQPYASSANSLVTSVTKAAAKVTGSSDASTSLYIGVETSNANPYLQVSNATGTISDPLLLQPFGGRVGIGTTSPSTILDLTGNGNPTITFNDSSDGRSASINGDAGNLILTSDTAASRNVVFRTISGSESVRIDASGRLLVGTSTNTNVASSVGALVQTRFAGSFTNFAAIRESGPAAIVVGRANGSAAQIVANNDILGEIRFAGADGVDLETQAAVIKAEVDGTPGANDMPGRLVFSTTSDGASSPTERLRIDSSGRVGIGTASPNANLDLAGTISRIRWDVNNAYTKQTCANAAFSGFTQSVTSASEHIFQISDGEKARLDSSGRLLVGTSSAPTNVYPTTAATTPSTVFDSDSNQLSFMLNNNSPSGNIVAFARRYTAAANGTIARLIFPQYDGTNYRTAAQIAAEIDGTPGTADMPGRLVFSTTADGASSPTERMRIGNLGDTQFYANLNRTTITAVTAGSALTSGILFRGKHTATSTTTGTDCFYVKADGNVENTNNSYGAISDIKLKENIVDASSQWNDLKALQVRNYNFKEGQTHTQIGLIAQEVELVSPGLVGESPDRDEDGNDLGTVTKSVNYSVLYMKAVKALQEAMERIETLEGMVAVNNITIDEQQHQLSTLAARLTALETP